LEHPSQIEVEPHDIVFCYGLLYHLANPGVLIDWIGMHCSQTLLLETSVSREIDGWKEVREDAGILSQSLSGIGVRPSRNWIFRKLRDRFEYVYIPLTQPAHEEFPEDWSPAKLT